MRNVTAGIALRLVAGGVLIAAAAFVGGVPGTASSQESPAGTVTIIASWTGNKTPGTEGYDFQQVLNAFQNATGIRVTYTGTRALDQLLQSDILQGSPPDLAILPSPGELLQYQREGYLQPLGASLFNAAGYGPQWLTIMKLGTSKLYTLPVKTDLQNLVWYDPRHWAGANMPSSSGPTSWSQLVDVEQGGITKGGAPWCLGLDSPPTSGWPGTDWIGNILLAQSGISVYQQWADGKLPWTSPQVRAAWQAWGDLVGHGQVYGGSMAALISPWTVTGAREPDPLFTNPPGCYLQDAASFITLDYQQSPNSQHPGIGYDFFPFPTTGLPDQAPQTAANAWEVSADLLAMFHGTPAAKRLVQFLAGEGAQRIWPAIPDGGASSADRQVPLTTYPDPVGRAIASTLTSPSATLCFDASDLMPATMQDGFYQAVMEYLRNPSQLSDILRRLDKIRTEVYGAFPGGKPNFSCGSP